MAKIPIPFTIVTCPLCGVHFDRRLNEKILSQHIQSRHPNEPIKPLVETVLDRLKLGLPSNIDELSRDELCEFLENMCQYEETTLGLKRLRRSFRRR